MPDPFAPPLSKLGSSGIAVASAPTGGLGMALTPDGKLPAGVLFVGTSPRRIAIGVTTLTWTAAVASATVTVSHSLGVAPVAVVANIDSSGIANAFAEPSNFTATSFDIRGVEFTNVAKTGTNQCWWIAIG